MKFSRRVRERCAILLRLCLTVGGLFLVTVFPVNVAKCSEKSASAEGTAKEIISTTLNKYLQSGNAGRRRNLILYLFVKNIEIERLKKWALVSDVAEIRVTSTPIARTPSDGNRPIQYLTLCILSKDANGAKVGVDWYEGPVAAGGELFLLKKSAGGWQVSEIRENYVAKIVHGRKG